MVVPSDLVKSESPNIPIALDDGTVLDFHLVPWPLISVEKELFQMHKHLILQRLYHIQHTQVQDTYEMKRKQSVLCELHMWLAILANDDAFS